MKARGLTKETILDFGVEERNFPEFSIGDTLEISQNITEGAKSRIQKFEGCLIGMHKNGISTTITVRKIGANGVGVEKIFPFYSKNLTEIKVIKKGKVRRAKLNYLRDRVGRSARVKELVLTKEQELNAENAKKHAQPGTSSATANDKAE